MALPTASDNVFPKVIISEAAAPASPSAGQFKLFVDSSDHLLKYKNSAGTVVTLGAGLSDPMTTRGDIIVRNASNVTARLAVGATPGYVLTSDGTDVAWAAPGGGGGVTKAFAGYNAIGGSGETMTQQRLYAKQITVGGADVVLESIECYIQITAEAVLTMGFALFEDSGSNTIGDMIEMVTNAKASEGFAAILAHGTGSYPARWYGMSFGRFLTAGAKYWLGISYLDGSAAPSLKYDGSGSDRYYAAGTGPYIGDGAYTAFTQTDSTRKYSIRGLTIT